MPCMPQCRNIVTDLFTWSSTLAYDDCGLSQTKFVVHCFNSRSTCISLCHVFNQVFKKLLSTYEPKPVMNWIAIVCLNWIIFPSLLIFARDWELVRCITGKRGLRERRVVEGIFVDRFCQSIFDFLLSEILVARPRVIRVENKVLSPLSSYQSLTSKVASEDQIIEALLSLDNNYEDSIWCYKGTWTCEKCEDSIFWNWKHEFHQCLILECTKQKAILNSWKAWR